MFAQALYLLRLAKKVLNRVRHALGGVAAGQAVYAVLNQSARRAARDDERRRALHRRLAYNESRADALHGKQAERALRVEPRHERFVRHLTQKTHRPREAEVPRNPACVLFVRPATGEQELKTQPLRLEQRRRLQHARQVLIRFQTPGEQQRGRVC